MKIMKNHYRICFTLFLCMLLLLGQTGSSQRRVFAKEGETGTVSEATKDQEESVKEEEKIKTAFCPNARAIHLELDHPLIADLKSDTMEAFSPRQETNVISLNKKDYKCLLKIVEAEAGVCDQKGKILVANVVLNRMNSRYFPDTVTEVVYQKNQFSPVSNGTIDQVEISEETKEAVSRALSGTDYSEGALFFAARKLSSAKNMKWFDESLDFLFEHDGHEFFAMKQ